MDRAAAFFADMWNLGSPIDVVGFFNRDDIPEDSKWRVQQAAMMGGHEDVYRLMQDRILDEVRRLGMPTTMSV